MQTSRFIKYFLLLFFTNFFIKGFSQVRMTIYNMSSTTLDSVVFSLYKPLKIGPIGKSASKTIFINGDQAYFHSFVPFSISYYSSILNIKKQWEKNGLVDTIYFFDHGVSTKRQKLRQPDEYRIWINNESDFQIDSIWSLPEMIVKKQEHSPRTIIVSLDHKKASENCELLVKVNNVVHSINMTKTQINNWHESGDFFYIYNDTMVYNTPLDIKSKEFVVYIQQTVGDEIIPIKVKSTSLLKAYSDGYGWRAVFDYERLSIEPEISIKIDNLKWKKIKLNFSEIGKRDFKDFYLSNKKKLTDQY